MSAAQAITIPDDLVDCLRSARHVAVLTGAGISAESGVPTFRDALSGLWAKYRPEVLATPEAFVRNPGLVWEWYTWRRELVRTVQPNEGHRALARLADRFETFTLITQNVDGLHQRAGSREVIELHGNLARVKCFEQGHIIADWQEDGTVPPRCPRCQGRLRPDVVWFGEALPEAGLAAAFAAASDCDVFFAIGTSGLVHPAADLPLAALRAGRPVVELNPEPTPLSRRCTYQLRGNSGAILPVLVAALG